MTTDPNIGNVGPSPGYFIANVGGQSPPPPPPPPPPAYKTGAVSFDGATELNLAALASTDNALVSISAWRFLPALQTKADIISDPTGNDWLQSNLNALAAAFEVDFFSSDFSVFGATVYNGGGAAAWHHFLYSIDIGASPHAKVFIDGIDATSAEGITGSGGHFSLNGNPFNVGGHGVNIFTGYLADVWIAPGQSLLTAGTIAPATVAKFISGGKPVDLGANGATPTGIAPAIYLRRVPLALPATFAVDKSGHGNTFTVTGALLDAPSSPTD